MMCLYLSGVAFACLLANVNAQFYPLVDPLRQSLQVTQMSQHMMDKFNEILGVLNRTNQDFVRYMNYTLLDILHSSDLALLPPIIVNALDESVWTFLGPARILTLGNLRVNALLTQNKIDPKSSLYETVQAYMLANVTTPAVVTAIGTQQSKPVTLQVMEDRLGDPTTWTMENITAMKDILFFLPNEKLMNIRDRTLLDLVNRQIQLCITDGSGNERKSVSCPNSQEGRGQIDSTRGRRFMGLRSWMNIQMYGQPTQWSNETFALMDVTTIPIGQLALVQPSVLVSKTPQIIQMIQQDSRKRAIAGRMLVRNILIGKNVLSMGSDTEVISVLNGLGSVAADFVRTSDLPAAALRNEHLMHTMKTRSGVSVANGVLGGQTTAMYIKMLVHNATIHPTEARNLGMALLSLAPPGMLYKTLNDMNPTRDELAQLVTAIYASSGISARPKLRMIKEKIFSMAAASGALDIGLVPPNMYDMLDQRTIQNIPKTTALLMLEKMDSLTRSQIGMLLSKLGGLEMAGLLPNARAGLSLRQASTAATTQSTLQRMVKDMPATSALAQYAAVNAWWSSVNDPISMVPLGLGSPMFPILGASEARRILNTTLTLNLEILKDAVPTREACLILKRILVNVSRDTQGTTSDAEAFSLLNLADTLKIPVGVYAAFGNERISTLDKNAKCLLMEHLIMMGDMVYRSTGIPINTAMHIIYECYNAMSKPVVLTTADVDKLQTQLLLVPTNFLQALQSDAAYDALRILNYLAMTPLMPCLDGGRKGAIVNMMYNYLGHDPSQWEDLSAVNCLLYLLPAGTLNTIPPATLAGSNCIMTNVTLLSSFIPTKQMLCSSDSGVDYNEDVNARAGVKDLQAKAYLSLIDPYANRRRKRAINDIPVCDQAALLGADGANSYALENIKREDMNACLPVLGGKPMQQWAATILAAKIKLAMSPQLFSSLSLKNMSDMGYIYRGIEVIDIPTLGRLSYSDLNDAVLSLGRPDIGFNYDQLHTWAAKVLRDWKSPISDWTASDMLIFNGLFCAVNSTIIDQLNVNYVKDALPMIARTVTKCSPDDRPNLLTAFANKAMQAYGPPSGWNKALIRELDIIFAGLSPTNLMMVPPQAMGGVTVSAIQALPHNAIAALSPSQVLNLDATAAYSVSIGQQAVLGGNTMQALREAQGSGGVMWRASSAPTALLLLLGSALTLMV